MNYYDNILVLIPALLIVGVGVSLLTNVSIQAAIIGGSILSIAALGHGMFIKPPVDPSIVMSDSSTDE